MTQLKMKFLLSYNLKTVIYFMKAYGIQAMKLI